MGSTASGTTAASTVGQHQHRGWDRRLVDRAEELAADAGYDKLAIRVGIGVRQCYREKLGYRQYGHYVSKRL